MQGEQLYAYTADTGEGVLAQELLRCFIRQNNKIYFIIPFIVKVYSMSSNRWGFLNLICIYQQLVGAGQVVKFDKFELGCDIKPSWAGVDGLMRVSGEYFT